MSEQTSTTRIPVQVERTPYPRSVNAYRASIGTTYAYGATAAEAKAAVGRIAQTFLEALESPVSTTYREWTLFAVMVPNETEGWAWETHRIGPRGASSGTSYSDAGRSRADVLARLEWQAVDSVTNYLDDADVRAAAAFLAGASRPEGHDLAELTYRTAWQRAAAHVMASGRTDWHEAASEAARTPAYRDEAARLVAEGRDGVGVPAAA